MEKNNNFDWELNKAKVMGLFAFEHLLTPFAVNKQLFTYGGYSLKYNNYHVFGFRVACIDI